MWETSLQDDYTNIVGPRLTKMNLGVVRKFVDLRWFADTEGAYDWNSTMMQAFYATLQTHQDNGVDVQLCIWRVPTWMGSDNK